MGRRRGAWRRLDAAPAGRRIPTSPPSRRARRAPARPSRLPRCGAPRPRAQAPARVRRRTPAASAHARDGRRRLQPQGRAGARR